jgi:hypothetical protein
LHCRPVDAPVEKEHDEHGQVEGADGRVEHVAGVVGELAHPRTPHLQCITSPKITTSAQQVCLFPAYAYDLSLIGGAHAMNIIFTAHADKSGAARTCKIIDFLRKIIDYI